MSTDSPNCRDVRHDQSIPGARVVSCGVDEIVVRDSDSDRTPVVLIHGWGVDSLFNYGTVLASLRERVRVLALDLPGHGTSSAREPFTLERGAEIVWQVCDALGVERCILVGYSMGGPISQLAAGGAPDRVAGLVQIATGARLCEPGVLPYALGNAGRFAAHVARGAAWQGRAVGVRRNGEYRRVAGLSIGADVVALAEAFSGAVSYDGRRMVDQLTVPSVSVITVRDRVVTAGLQGELASLLGGVRIEVDAGHDLCRKEVFGDVVHRALDALNLTELRSRA